MQRLYAARSSEHLDAICAKLAKALHMPGFERHIESRYICSATSDATVYALELKEFLEDVDEDTAKRIGPPHFWDLAWRAQIGFNFNYQITLQWAADGLSRSHARRIRLRLREVFEYVHFHGEKRKAQPAGGAYFSPAAGSKSAHP